MNPRITRKALRKLINAHAWRNLREQLAQVGAADIAAHGAGLRADELLLLLKALDDDKSTAVFAKLAPGFQQALIAHFTDRELSQLLARLATDDRVRFISSLTPSQAEALLRLMDASLSRETQNLLGWSEDAVGRLMDTRTARFQADTTVNEALAWLRSDRGRQLDHVDRLFLVDQRQRITGSLELHDLLAANGDLTLDELARPVQTVILASESVSKAAELARHYDLEIVPIVNEEGRFLGVVTFDDLMDAARDLNTADFHRSAGIGRLGESIRHARPSLLYRKRVGWLLVLLLGGLGTSSLLASAEATLGTWLVLILFLPLVIDSAGNAGAQSALLTVRALATGDVSTADWPWLLRRELLIALGLGLTVAVPAAGLGWLRGELELALLIAITLPACVLFGSLIGLLLPLGLTRLRLDPAYASAPLVTSLADLTGLGLYLALASLLL